MIGYLTGPMKKSLNLARRSCSVVAKIFCVVTTIFDPTIAVKRVSKLNDWCFVIVADKKAPIDYLLKYDESGPCST